MIISFFQILELWIQWIIIETTYPFPLKLFMIITKIPEDIPRRRDNVIFSKPSPWTGISLGHAPF